MKGRTIAAVAVVLGLAVAACSSDPTTSVEYLELEDRLATLEDDLASVTAERDALTTESELRHGAALANQEALIAILDDPESAGSEEEIAALLATFATPDAVMDDAVFGAVPYEQGFYNTLFGGAVDAVIDVYHQWVSEDGSQGGFLWNWHGTNLAGNEFELTGISLVEYDAEGLITYEYVVYPYPNSFVISAFMA